MIRPVHLSAVVACATALLATSIASAAPIERQVYQNGGSACTGALPTYEGSLRKRPLAIANEGSSNAFVTCSLPHSERNSSYPTLAYLRVENVGETDISVTCTLVLGARFESSVAIPQTVSVASGSSVYVPWEPSTGATYLQRRTVNFSCNLPPNGGVSYVGQRFLEEVGQL